MSKVVQFPDMMKERENEKSREEYLVTSVQEVTNEVIGELMYHLYEIGYDLDEETYIKEVSLIYDSVRSLLLSVEGIEHPYQDFARVVYGGQDGEFRFDIE